MVIRVLLALWGLLLLPVVVLSGLRLASTATFASLEYHRPGFPADPYGLTSHDRQLWSNRVLEYVLGHEQVESLSLADLLLRQSAPGREAGLGNRAFCSRELRHLTDVKALLQPTLLVWQVSLGIWALGLLALAIRREAKPLAQTLRVASAVTLGCLILGGLVGLLSAEGILPGIHHRFFEGNSYLFYTTDTLLRIYPHEYWRDFLIFVGVFSLVTATAVHQVSVWALKRF